MLLLSILIALAQFINPHYSLAEVLSLLGQVLELALKAVELYHKLR